MVEEGVSLHHCFPSWRVHLLNPDSLPELVSMRSLRVEVGAFYCSSSYPGRKWASSKLDLRILVDLIIKLPNLQSLSCAMGGDEWSPRLLESLPATYYLRDWEGPRRDSRNDFASALQANYKHIPKGLRCANLDFLFPIEAAEDIDHRTSMPDIISPAPYVPISSSLRLLSSHLRQLQLRVSADQTLFWPEGEASIPAWPQLESLEVMFHPVSPSGTWYFEGPKGEGSGMTGFKVDDTCYPPLEGSEYDGGMDWECGNRGARLDRRKL